MSAIKTIENFAVNSTNWVGSVLSSIVHIVIFIGAFGFLLFGISLDKILLVLTTMLSFEAIYLSIFIQMSVNRHENALQNLGEDIEEIQESVEEMSGEIEDIGDDIEYISNDLVELQENLD